MLTSIKRIVLLVLIGGLALSGCRKDKFDEYYGRPDSLADPIYQQLNAKGNFTILLKMIDKAGYKDILSKAGYWTFFAPNDAAFTKFFQENSISSADAVTDEMANKIVRYALVYNAFKTDHLADYQSNVGWVLNEGYKRRTAYYDGFYTDASNRVVLSSNRNNTSGTNYYTVGDNNNKYLPYFYSKYFTPKNLTAADYTYFYPNDTFTGFNMAGGKVETTDIIAENGVIHEVSVVNMPLKNIEQHLASNDNYSLFKSILEKYLVTYVKNETATKNYNILTGKSDDVFIKVYDPSLAYSPNNENYLKVTDNDGQTDGYTMFAPNNTSLQAFINTVLLEHFASVDKLPKAIISDLINAHMWQSTVWPSKFATTRNFLGEEARFNNTTDIIEKKVASNGMFYGTNKVQKANVFYTVYSKPYLDPAYSLMTRALNEELKFIITNPNLKFTIFMMSDAVLKAKGFDFDLTRNEWVYVPPGGTNVGGALAKVRIMRILNSSV